RRSAYRWRSSASPRSAASPAHTTATPSPSTSSGESSSASSRWHTKSGATRGLRLVLDTNVWLDWLVFRDPSVAPIAAAVAAGRAEVFIDAACEAELEHALGYDLGGRAVDAAACLAECRRVARRVALVVGAGRPALPACRDPHDQKFLEVALAAGARFLVTKDKALLQLARRGSLPFRIVTPQALPAEERKT